MSQLIHFITGVTEPKALQAACDSMRKQGLSVVGPEYKKSCPNPVREGGGPLRIDAYEVKLPNWHYPCLFDCANGQMYADNYSDYGHDHPDVLAGKKRAGEGGRWGDISYLEKLKTEYHVAPVMELAAQQGLQVTRQQLDGVENGLRMVMDVPGQI